MSASLRTALGRLAGIYHRWAARSAAGLAESEGFLAHARALFHGNAAALRADRLPWCSRCGERLGNGDDSEARVGIHARCHGG